MRRGEARMVLTWRVPQGQARLVAAALQGVMLSTRQEQGCLGGLVSTSASDHVTVRYTEDWDTEEHLRLHVRSDGFRTLAGLIESAIETPQIEFVLPDGTHGIEYAENAREAS